MIIIVHPIYVTMLGTDLPTETWDVNLEIVSIEMVRTMKKMTDVAESAFLISMNYNFLRAKGSCEP